MYTNSTTTSIHYMYISSTTNTKNKSYDYLWKFTKNCDIPNLIAKFDLKNND